MASTASRTPTRWEAVLEEGGFEDGGRGMSKLPDLYALASSSGRSRSVDVHAPDLLPAIFAAPPDVDGAKLIRFEVATA